MMIPKNAKMELIPTKLSATPMIVATVLRAKQAKQKKIIWNEWKRTNGLVL